MTKTPYFVRIKKLDPISAILQTLGRGILLGIMIHGIWAHDLPAMFLILFFTFFLIVVEITLRHDFLFGVDIIEEELEVEKR